MTNMYMNMKREKYTHITSSQHKIQSFACLGMKLIATELLANSKYIAIAIVAIIMINIIPLDNSSSNS